MYHRSGTGVCYCIVAGRRFVFIHQSAALFCIKWRHDCHLKIMTSNRKFDYVSRCASIWRKSLPNFIPIRFQTTEPLAFFEEVAPNKRNNKNKMSSDMRSVPDLKYSSGKGHNPFSQFTLLLWDTPLYSGVAWVIGAQDGLQFCRPRKPWDALCYFITPNFYRYHPIFVVPSRFPPSAVRPFRPLPSIHQLLHFWNQIAALACERWTAIRVVCKSKIMSPQYWTTAWLVLARSIATLLWRMNERQ